MTLAPSTVKSCPEPVVVTMSPARVLKLPEARSLGVIFCPTTWWVSSLVRAGLSARILFNVADGIFANAPLYGANTVMFWALLRVSTRPACFTALTSVDSTGLWLAAVATGSVAMPWKLPGPLAGTALHAEPNCAAGAAESLGADSDVVVPLVVVAGAADGE